MFTSALNCADEIRNNYYDFERFGPNGRIPLIFDGGIRDNGDIAKALVAGGGGNNLVMAGSLFAACIDAPGENVYSEEQKAEARRASLTEEWYQKHIKREFLPVAKFYHGSASHIQKGEKKHVEGVQLEIPCNGMTYSEKYQELRESLSSAVSYAGGNSLAAFKNVEWVSVK